MNRGTVVEYHDSSHRISLDLSMDTQGCLSCRQFWMIFIPADRHKRQQNLSNKLRWLNEKRVNLSA